MRPKTCKSCKEKFQPTRQFQVVCEKSGCAYDYVIAQKEAKRKKDHREQKRALKTKPQLTSEAQAAFNKFIRLRDKDDCCISCGRHEWEIQHVGTGGKWDCGHYLTIGAHREIRFHEDNAHRQCKKCNGGAGNFSRKDKAVSQEYRYRLVQKIGIEAVEWLEGPHEPKKYTKDELIQIKKTYQKKTREL